MIDGSGAGAIVNPVDPQAVWIYNEMPLRVDGSGTTQIRCQRATFEFFRLDKLPPSSFDNPGQPDFKNGYRSWPIRNSNVARKYFRIAYEEWPGHKKPRMASISIVGPWLQESYEVIHRHLIDNDLPYLYLCNEHGNKISDSWSSGLRPRRKVTPS